VEKAPKTPKASPPPLAKSRNVGWTFLAFLAGLYMGGFVLFVWNLPLTPVHTTRGDGIVALTGGDSRLDAAVALLEEGAGKRLLISGVHQNTTKADLKRLVHGGPRFDCCVDLGFSAQSTRGNAAEAATWARKHGYRSLVIVTANYHMPRSLHEFADAMPGVRLLPYPVQQDDVDVAEWWSDSHTLRVLHLEYAKYLGSLFFSALDSSTRKVRPSREARNGSTRRF
jgi:uncharacterized SAM-binding protein YcdF (DUF218 family)